MSAGGGGSGRLAGGPVADGKRRSVRLYLNVLGVKYAKTRVVIVNAEAGSPPGGLGCCSAIINK